MQAKFTLYARRETTTDSTTLTHWVKGHLLPRDVVFYRDEAAERCYCVCPWHYDSTGKMCPSRTKTKILNCVKWRVVWLEPLPQIRK